MLFEKFMGCGKFIYLCTRLKGHVMESNYLDELNERQREAVLYNDGPSLVMAGAGS